MRHCLESNKADAGREMKMVSHAAGNSLARSASKFAWAESPPAWAAFDCRKDHFVSGQTLPPALAAGWAKLAQAVSSCLIAHSKAQLV